jgi:hypothetical protein
MEFAIAICRFDPLCLVGLMERMEQMKQEKNIDLQVLDEMQSP